MPRSTTDAWAACVALLLAAPLAAQDGLELGDPGPQYCANCHFNVPNKNVDEHQGVKKYWVGEHWAGWQADPHRRASEVLDQPLGKRMAKLLAEHAADPASWKGGVRTDARCTSCHGGPAKGAEATVAAGLNCFDCHQQPAGGGLGPDKWVTAHAFLAPSAANPKVTRWRALPANDKRKLGFRPLHDPAERAANCLSCHVGSAAEGKFVTHEMYAAGHPPLGSVELAKFTDEYSEAHWLPPRDERKAGAGFVDDAAAFRAQLAVQGALAALRAQAELAEAAAQPEPLRRHLAWGDYAFLDCASCHHDLAEKSWRRQRAEGGPAATGAKVYGRPPLLEWPSALPLALHGEALAKPLEAFRLAATDAPFGTAKNVGAAAAALQSSLTQAASAMNGPQDWRKLLRQALAHGAARDLDFDSARQVAWLSEALALSLADAGNDPAAKALMASLTKLAFPREPRALPKWSAGSPLPDLAAADRWKGLAEQLAAKRQYDPAAFRQWCRDALAAAFPAAP